MKSLLVSLLLLVVLCEFNEALVRKHIFVDEAVIWKDALRFCRKRYSDLSTVISDFDDNWIKEKVKGNGMPGWIGLRRSDKNPTIFVWSDGEQQSFFRWQYQQPSDVNETCVEADKFGWNDNGCWRERKFFCEKILVLVKENKTWDEALEYCRDHYKGLASLITNYELFLAKIETRETQTASVWTGLRFLAGEWIWVNGDSVEDPDILPSCPAQPYRCGARNNEAEVWENRDCEEKLNFLCY